MRLWYKLKNSLFPRFIARFKGIIESKLFTFDDVLRGRNGRFGMGDNSATVGLVKSSYDDVNNALESLLGNVSGNTANYVTNESLIKTLANYATVSQLSSTAGNAPVGTVYAFVTSTVPNGYLLCNGATFSQTNFPNLYSALGSSTLPDMRGLFLRGLDTTGNIDYVLGGRSLLSFEEGSLVIKAPTNGQVYGWSLNLQNPVNETGNSNSNTNLNWDNMSAATASKSYNLSVATGSVWDTNTSVSTYGGPIIGVTRPKNIAVNYIIKAS